jgi:hypothetical protein
MVKWMKIKNAVILKLGIIGIFTLLLFAPGNLASAQSDTWLAISPEESTVPLGNQVVLELLVTSGAHINAYDLTLSYDPAIILLTGWEHGDYLSSLAVVKKEDTPGTFRLAATQLAQPEVSGDGVLLILTFETRVEGDSLVEIVEAVFADSQGGSVEPELLSGWVYVSLLPTFTSTPSASPTPEGAKETTPEATQTPTATLTGQESSPTPASTGEQADGMEVIREGTPSPQTDESYPVAGDLEGQSITGNGQGDNYPLEETDQNSERSPSDTYSEAETLEDESLAAQQEVKLNRLLWSVVIVSAVALGLMIIIIIRRKNRKNEDLLL